MRAIIKKAALILLCFVMIIQLVGCGGGTRTQSGAVSTETEAAKIKLVSGDEFDEKITDFSMELFARDVCEGRNSMISPISILTMLAMVENGAAGDTLKQLEEATNMSAEELTGWLMNFAERADMASSVWFKDCDGFKMREDYIAEMTEYFGADVFSVPFDSNTTEAIDKWVEKATNGMIKKMNKKFKPTDKFVLLNAVSFEKEWKKAYEDYQVSENEDFYCHNGSVQKVTMLYSEESKYIEDEMVHGFIKPYKDGYSFVALCDKPDGAIKCGTQINMDCANHLTGGVFRSLIRSAKDETVKVVMPEFKHEYNFTEFEKALKDMGIIDMFDERADLTELESSESGIFIDEVIHKSFIEVSRKGTRAAAASLANGCEKMAIMEMHEIRLDRPFIYAIIDDETGVPLFTGAVARVQQ